MQKIVAVDFDGTVVEHRYPEIGETVPGAIETLQWLNEQKVKIILWTIRSGKELDEAVAMLKDNGIEIYGINKTPGQWHWSKSPKAYAQHYIDDAALGCPLIYPESGERPYVDWKVMRELVTPMATK